MLTLALKLLLRKIDRTTITILMLVPVFVLSGQVKYRRARPKSVDDFMLTLSTAATLLPAESLKFVYSSKLDSR